MAPVVTKRKNIQVQLAKFYEGQPLKGRYIAEPKYDGLRGVIIVHSTKLGQTPVVNALTRTGLPIPNATHIALELLDSGKFDGMVLDGEFLADNWNLSQSIVKSQSTHPEAETLKFYVFDMVSFADWVSKKNNDPLHKRKGDLVRRAVGLKFTKNVPHTPCSTPEKILVTRDDHVKAGFEGIMLKDYDAPYRFKKSSDWLKAKPYFEGDFTVVSAFEGKGKHLGRLGGLKIVGTVQWKGAEVAVESEVGTGFDDAAREALWVLPELVGSTVEVEFQEVTEDGALRFPVFRRVRGDK
jgi:ATP-dependent DNA ligase